MKLQRIYRQSEHRLYAKYKHMRNRWKHLKLEPGKFKTGKGKTSIPSFLVVV